MGVINRKHTIFDINNRIIVKKHRILNSATLVESVEFLIE